MLPRIGGLSPLFWLLLLPASAAAQPDAGAFPLSVLRSGSMYLNDESLQRELKLSGDQISKLQDQRQRYFTASFAARENSRARDRAVEAYEKALRQILTSAQLQRLRQVMIQQLDQRSQSAAFGPTLLRYTDLTADLKLSDDQKARVRDGELLAGVLSDDQKQQWRELQGEAFKGQLRQGFGPPVTTGRPPPPTELSHLLQKPVQDELKLAPEQTKRIAVLEQQRTTLLVNFGQLAPQDQQQKRLEASSLVAKEIERILDAPQRERLRQIGLQELQRTTDLTAIFTHPAVAKELPLGQEQLDRLLAFRRERRIAALQIFVTGGSCTEIVRKTAEFKRATYSQMVARLSPEQQTKVQDLLGEPFKGALTRPGPFGPTSWNPASPLPARSSFAYEFLHLRDSALQTELKLTPEQAKKAAELQGRFNEESRKGPDALNVWTEKTLTELLQPAQLKRFREIMLQERELRGGLEWVIATPGVVEQLALSNEQQEQVRSGKPAAEVLTMQQQTSLKELLGAPYAGMLNPLGFPAPPALPVATPALTLHCLDQKSVQEEVRLTGEQRQAVADLTRQHYHALQKLQSLAATQRLAATREREQVTLRKAEAVLDAGQTKRLRQIVWQQSLRDLPATVGAPLVKAALRLNADQERQVRVLQTDADRTRGLLRSELALLGREQNDPDGTARKFDWTVERRFARLLTAEQRTGWSEVIGEPFHGRIPPLPRGPFAAPPTRSG